MFFYRPWAGSGDNFQQSANSGPDFYTGQFDQHRWGFAALMLLTLLACIVLNGAVLGSFMFDWKNLKKMPHTLILTLCIRDLLVALILIPICIDWYIVHVGAFPGGQILCRITAFFDFTLATEYALLLIVMAVVLYTRKFPKFEDTLDDLPMQNQMNYSQPPSVSYPPSHRQPQSRQSGSRPPSVQNGSRPPSVQNFSRPPSAQNGSRPPSVTGSRAGSRQGSRAPSVVGSQTGRGGGGVQPGFQPKRPNLATPPKRPGSVTGSIEGRLATSTPRGRAGERDRQFMASSPLQEETEEDMDLWDAASMDYPGRQSPRNLEDWEQQEQFYENEDVVFFDEPRYHQWHLWLLGLSLLPAMAMGIIAALFVEHRVEPNGRFGVPQPSRPGCFVPADPFKNPHSATINDPGFNFNLSFVIVTYLITFCTMILMFCLICYQSTKNSKYQRFFKMLISCFIIFMISRGPIDLLQLKGLIEAAMGFKQLNILAYELEYEILIIWATYIPLVLHPIVFLAYASEYRSGALKTFRTICGCQKKHEIKEQAKMDQYKVDEIMSERSHVSKTQVSNIL